MSVTFEVRVESDDWQNSGLQIDAVCQRAFAAAAAIGNVVGEVSLLLTGHGEIQALNRDWRGKDTPTDVLSFASAAEDRPFLGDIAIGFGVASGDATSRNIELDQHVSHLLIHGYLHLIGYDHIDDTEAAKMIALEVAALASLGWPDPYSI